VFKGVCTFSVEPEQFAGEREITSELRHSRHLRHEGELLSLSGLHVWIFMKIPIYQSHSQFCWHSVVSMCEYSSRYCQLFLGRLQRVDLIISIWGSDVRPSAKSFSNSDEIWHVGKGRWVMHDGMPYDPIQGQGHETFKVRNSSIFKIYLLRHFSCELANDHWFWNYGTISNFCTEQIFDSCPSFCVTWLRTWNNFIACSNLYNSCCWWNVVHC